jgi:hypothetical protein
VEVLDESMKVKKTIVFLVALNLHFEMVRPMCVLLLALCCSNTITCWPTTTGNDIRFSGIEFKCQQGNYFFPAFSKVRGNHRNHNSAYSCSLLPSWIVPSAVQKMFTKTVQVVQDPRFFFNRDKEINALRDIFNGPPRLTVMLGPPSAGKTRLVNRVVSSLKVDGTPEFHALNINLRGVALDNGKQFWEHVEGSSRIASAADKAWILFAESASKIRSLKLSAKGLEVGLQELNSPCKNYFDSLAKAVPVWKGGSDVPFVLVIDEANALKILATNDFSVSQSSDKGADLAYLCLSRPFGNSFNCV